MGSLDQSRARWALSSKHVIRWHRLPPRLQRLDRASFFCIPDLPMFLYSHFFVIMLSPLLLGALICVAGTLAVPGLECAQRPYNQLLVPSNCPQALSFCSSHFPLPQCT